MDNQQDKIVIPCKFRNANLVGNSSEFRGGADAPFVGIRPPADPKSPPLYYIYYYEI